MRHIFFVIHEYSGANTYAEQLRCFLQGNEKVRLCIVHFGSTLYREFTVVEDGDVLIFHFPFPGKRDLAIYSRRVIDVLSPWLKNKKELVFHLNNLNQHHLGMEVKKRFGAKVVFTIHFLMSYFTACAEDHAFTISLYYYLNYENRSWVCMNILNNLNSLIEKEYFLQYWDAIGDMELSTETMGQIEAYIKSQGINYMEGMDTVKIDGGYYFRKSVNFYNSPEFDYAFGTATVYFDTDGKLVGFSDNYNFDWKFWWEKETRTWSAEWKTRATSIVVFFNQAQAYSIYYGVHE